MLSLPQSVRVYAASAPVDLRKGFDALAALVRQTIAGDPLSGHLFVFFNRRGNRVKVLFWTRGGYALFYKRLEQGRFLLPHATAGAARLELEVAELQALLEGIDLRGAKRQAAWTPKSTRAA